MVGALIPEAATRPIPPPARARRNRLETRNDEGWFNVAKTIGMKFRWPGSGGAAGATPDGGTDANSQALKIRGLKGDLPVSFGDAGAVPGDRIVGIMTPGEGIKIYQIHSPKLQRFEDGNSLWMDVTWDIPEDSDERFPATIDVSVLNEPGILAQVAQVIGDADGNIDTLRMMRRAPDFTTMRIGLEIWDLEHLNKIVAGLKAKPVVNAVSVCSTPMLGSRLREGRVLRAVEMHETWTQNPQHSSFPRGRESRHAATDQYGDIRQLFRRAPARDQAPRQEPMVVWIPACAGMTKSWAFALPGELP